jgi:hypothetical protein
MTSLSSWIAHFKDMSENKLSPGTLQFVRSKGGAGRVYYRIQQQPIISPAAQVIQQAKARVSKAKNKERKKPSPKKPWRKKKKALTIA